MCVCACESECVCVSVVIHTLESAIRSVYTNSGP